MLLVGNTAIQRELTYKEDLTLKLTHALPPRLVIFIGPQLGSKQFLRAVCCVLRCIVHMQANKSKNSWTNGRYHVLLDRHRRCFHALKHKAHGVNVGELDQEEENEQKHARRHTVAPLRSSRPTRPTWVISDPDTRHT